MFDVLEGAFNEAAQAAYVLDGLKQLTTTRTHVLTTQYKNIFAV